MIKRYARLPIESPRQIVVIVALLTLVLSPFLLQVEFATDVDAFLPQSSEVETYDKISEDFGSDSSIVNLYLTSVTGQNILTLNNLEDILDLHNQCSEIEGVKDVLSVADFFDSALKDSDMSLTKVKESENPWLLVYNSISSAGGGNYSWGEVDFVTDVLVNKDLNLDPLIIQSEDSLRSAPLSNSTIILVNLEPDLTTEQKKDVGQKIRLLSQIHNKESGSEVYAETFSVDLLAYDVDKSTQETNLRMAVGMLVVTTILLWLSFRHWSYVVLPLVTLIISVFWTFAFAGMLGIKLTALAVAVIPLVVGLGIDFAVHISRRYQEGLKAGNSVEESLLEAQMHTGQALSLAMMTTVIAFLSGISAGVGPVRDFSILCAIGIFISFMLTLFFYTSLRYILDSDSESTLTAVKDSQIVESVISKTSEMVDKNPLAILSTVLIITLIAAFYGSQVDTSFGLDDFVSDDLEIMVTARNIDSDFRGASYSQSQILIEGPIATTDFLNSSYQLQYGERDTDNDGLNRDRYVITVGSSARVDSVYEIVRNAAISEDYNINQGSNTTHDWITTTSFKVVPNESIEVAWNTINSPEALSLEVYVLWYDQSNSFQESERVSVSLIDNEASQRTIVPIVVPPTSYYGKIEFKYLYDGTDDIVYDITVDNSDNFIYVQSVIKTFNLSYVKDLGTLTVGTLSKTTDQDIESLFDYLYQRDLDIFDTLTQESYSEAIKHVLYRNMDGDYTSSVVRVYIGPNSNYELDNEGLEYMRSELEDDIPSTLSSEDYKVSITGGHVLTSVTVNEIQTSQMSSTLVSIILAAIVLTLVYRSLEFGLIAILPTILATTWIMATMWAFDITLNVLTVMVTALTVGLGIDYAIHIIERYREEIEHKSESQAIEATIKYTGSAILISGLTTICGFGVLLLSPMPLVSNFGVITAATILYSILIAIFVLPSMIWTSNRIKEWYSTQILD